MYQKFWEVAQRVWGDKVEEKEVKAFVDIINEECFSVFSQTPDTVASYIEALITSMDEMVFLLDNDVRIINAWTPDDSVFWINREQFINKTLLEIFPKPLCYDLHNAILTVQETQQPLEIEYPDSFGNEYYVARLNFIHSNTNDKKHVSALVHNITDKKKAEKELIEAKHTAEEALKIKSEFLSSVSHEIRTPMNAIMGLTDILLEQKHNEETIEYLSSIRHSADNLLVIINDILNYSKLEAGKIVVENIPFRLDRQIAELKKMLGVKAEKKNIYYESSIHENVPLSLIGDPYRLNQVLINLIGNAIKFTDKGGVSCTVGVHFLEGKKAVLDFEIKDSGIGIPQDKIEQVFDSFVQASSDTSRKYGGTGLGLTITKDLVTLMGGQISLNSEIGKGSVFKVQIPFHVSDEDVAVHVINDNAEKIDLSYLTVLVAEDNPLNQLVISKILDGWNAHYRIAENGEIAIEILQKEKVDIVFMDLQMPVMDGFEAVSKIRSKDSEVLEPNVPIIAFTADAFPETKIKVLEAGMNDLIAKPFKKEDVYKKIMKQLSNK